MVPWLFDFKFYMHTYFYTAYSKLVAQPVVCVRMGYKIKLAHFFLLLEMFDKDVWF